MWLVTINKYHNYDDNEQIFVFDYKKDLIKALKGLGFKWSTFNGAYCHEEFMLWAYIEKIEKNKIELYI